MRGNHTLMFLSLPPFPSLKINTKNKINLFYHDSSYSSDQETKGRVGQLRIVLAISNQEPERLIVDGSADSPAL